MLSTVARALTVSFALTGCATGDHRETRPSAAILWLALATALVPPVLVTPDLAVAAPAPEPGPDPSDWTGFRGPERSGTAAGVDWPDEPSLELLWERPLGTGYSGLVVVGDRLFTAFGGEGSDWLGAFDAATGEELWRLSLGKEYPSHGGSHGGPLSTPAVNGGRVFAVGAHGRLVAAGLDGEILWSQELADWAEEPIFGHTSSPALIHGPDRTVLALQAPGRNGDFLYGLDPATGERLWTVGGDLTAFQSPVLAEIAGREQIVVSGVRAVYGVSAGGQVLWKHAFPPGPPGQQGPGINVPLVIGDDRVLVKADERSAIAIDVAPTDDGYATEVAWSTRDISKSYLPSTFHQGIVYGHKGSLISAIAPESGETLWRSRAPGDGFLNAADGHLVILTKRGALHLGEAGGEAWKEETWLQVFEDAVWTEPTVAQGDIFVRSVGGMARIDVRPAREATVADGEEEHWIDTDRPGAALPDTAFGRFVRSLEETADRAAAIDEFLATVESFPITEGDWAHFVYRGDEESVGISGDMLGERYEADMIRVPGTDLFYYSIALPRDAWVSYFFYPGLDNQAVADPRNPRLTVFSRQGAFAEPPAGRASYFTMPEWELPPYLRGEPTRHGSVETHELSLEDMDVHIRVPPFLRGEVDPTPPTHRRIRVYLPPGYDAERAAPYPVVYVFAGDAVFEALDMQRSLDHLLGDELPAAVAVFVDRIRSYLAYDAAFGFEAHRDTFFRKVVPFVEATYRVEATSSYLSFGFGGALALRTGLLPEADAHRVAAVQPFLLDHIQRPVLAQAQALASSERPSLYLETSRIDYRAVHEDWDISKEHREFVRILRHQGYEVILETTSHGFAWIGWTARVGPTLAFALTGEPEVPTKKTAETAAK